MRIHELSHNPASQTLIYRWVDEKGCLSYLRSNAMIGRVRHYLPKQLSGAFHSNFKTGLSFSPSPIKWSDSAIPICFVVDRTRLDSPVIDINGQAVFELTGVVDAYKAFHVTSNMKWYRDNAIQASTDDPDEAFVIGNIRNLSDKLVEIRIRNGASLSKKIEDVIEKYCSEHGIPTTRLNDK